MVHQVINGLDISGPPDPSNIADHRHDEIDAVLASLSTSLDWLLRLANMIRRASFLRQNTRASSFPLKDSTRQDATPVLRQLFSHFVKREFLTITEELHDRLVSTMLLRRRRVMYRRSRQVKLAVHTPKPAPKPAQLTIPVEVSGRTIPEELTRECEPLAPSGVTSTTQPSATTVDREMYHRVTTAQSRVSEARTIAMTSSDKRIIPPPPRLAPNQREFVCPFCCFILDAKHARNRDAWSKHVKNDLDPYICVFFPCAHGGEIIGTSAEWISHEQTHCMRWHCASKSHGPQMFASQDEFIAHTMAQHPGKFNKAQLPVLAEISQRPLKRIFDACPFCGQADLEKGQTLEDHVAHHLQNLAILSLPLYDDADDTDAKSASSIESCVEEQVAASRTTMKSAEHEMPTATFSYDDDDPLDTARAVDDAIPDIEEHTWRVDIAQRWQIIRMHKIRRLNVGFATIIDAWLSPPDHLFSQQKARIGRQEGSGQWFIRETIFTTWKTEPPSFLWLSGGPGCGKTVLSSTIIDHLQQHASDFVNPNILLYFYFTFSDLHQRSLESAIRSLVSQLYREQPQSQNRLDMLWSTCKDGTVQPSAQDLFSTFENMLQDAGETWLILDALDECGSQDGRSVPELLTWLQDLHSHQTNLHLLVTSRPDEVINSAISSFAGTECIFNLDGDVMVEGLRSFVHENHALHDPVVYNEMIDIKQELIDRLYFSKIDERLTYLTPAQGTTCRWFLTESKYRSWQDVAQQSEHGGFLWIKGNPGTGKSTLMKHLFEETKVNSKDDPSRITLSFFFLARGTAEEKTTMGLYRSFLHQLFWIAPDLKDSLEWMTDDGASSIQRNGWSEEALKQTLKYAVPKLGNRSLTMFVDALDECDENKAGDMVSFFEELCNYAVEMRVQVQICFSSRYYPTVVITKGIEVSLEDEIGHTEDIRKYVSSRLRLKSKSKHAEALRSEILEKSSGIFLWVVLVLDILNNDKSISIQRVRERLQEIPPKLNNLFQLILTRDGDNLEHVELCLNWILFASRALKPQELYFAIQLGSDMECSGFWDQADLDVDDMNTFVRSSSKGLAEVTRNKASEVQFIHESVRDFLLGKYGDQWSGTSENLKGHGHQVLRDCCLAQLNASITQQVEIPDPLPRASQAKQLCDTINSGFPFLEYSVRHVFHHSNLAQRNGIEQGPFLSYFPLRRWILINNALERYDNRRYTDSVSLLYIFGKDNLADLIGNHVRRKFCFEIEAERCGAPILAALANNSHEAVRTFLRAQAENEPPASRLHRLCEQYEQRGNKPTRFGRDFTFSRRRGILNDLINHDEEAVALAFVLSSHSHGDPVHSSDSLDLTTISLATERGHEDLVRLLLQRSAHVDQKSGWLDAPLLHAAMQGSEAIVRLLLERGANVQPSRQGCQTPLSNAAAGGHVAVVKLLLEKGADVESKDENGNTPLHHAAKLGPATGEVVMRLLLEKGADVDSRDKDGRTPLSWAAENFNYGEGIARLLLETGAYIDSRDKDGRTPLSWAAGGSGSQAAVARFLLDRGADIELKDKDGQTPLSWALSKKGTVSNDTVITLLREAGADIESKDTKVGKAGG